MRWFALVYLVAAAITLFLIVQIARVILELSQLGRSSVDRHRVPVRPAGRRDVVESAGPFAQEAAAAAAGLEAADRWKTTKSYALLDMCVSIATGTPAFGVFDIPKPGAVMFVNEESGRAALWRRLDALCRGRAIDPERLRGRLHVAANARVKLDDPKWQARLLADARSLEAELVVLDPLVRMKGVSRDESAQKEMDAVVEFIRELRDVSGAAVAFVHHTGHQGEHMRGTSDLESVWETKLQWKRDGQSPVVTLEAMHREAEPPAPFQYRIAWDGLTRSMRFEAVVDPERQRVREYLAEHPNASANEVYEVLGGWGSAPHRSRPGSRTRGGR